MQVSSNRWSRTRALRGDSGVSLPELLVAMVIAAAVIGVGIALVSFTGRMMTSSQASTQTMGQLESASTQLLRDVTDARQVIEATPSSLTLEVVRDTACVLTTWTAADDELRVSRTTFTQAPGSPGDPACASTGGERAEVRVVQRLTDDEPFEFFSRESTSEPLALPVSADDVARVTWALTATPAYPADADPRTVASGAAVAQSTGSTGGGASQDARAPLLEVVTPHEGVGQPVLRWADPTPAVTQAWTLFRIAYPEGGTAAGTWEALITLPGSQSTYTDASLPAGYTARYILRATLTDGRTGPTSPQVATGIRPAPVTLTATGQDASIVVSWTAATGATAYDLYRDGALYQQSLTGTSWTDATGRGHSHAYRVVPVSRWERCATRAATCTEALQSYQVPTGTLATTTLPGGSPTAVRRLSTANEAAGAYTSPLAPSLSTTPNANWSIDLHWSVNASWTGTGPVTKGGVHRDRGWQARVASGTGTTAGTWPSAANVWSGAETARGTTARRDSFTQAEVAGQYRHYQARTCNAVGCSPWSSTSTSLQRPPQPSCTAAKTGVTTRQVNIGIARPSMPSAYTSNRVNGWYEGGATSFVASTLAHSATHTFGVHTRNDSPANDGWSDEARCSATTDPLRISISGTSSSTRTVTASSAPTNGTSRTLTLEGVRTDAGTSSSWDPLRHATCFTLTARNSDGHNEVVDQRSVCTQRLTVAPAPTPSCSASADGTYAPTTVRWSSNGSLSRTALAVSSGGYYSATATITHTNSDGFNTVSDSASSSCGATVQNMPTPNTGAGGGAPSASCSSYRAIGSVQSLLATGVNGASAGSGFVLGSPRSGSFAADYGTQTGGSVAGGDLRCVFYREHVIIFTVTGQPVPGYYYNVAALWSMNGTGGV